jgi:hypothetical protein
MGRYEERFWDAGPIIHLPNDDGDLYGCEITDTETGLVGSTHRARSSKSNAQKDAWDDLMQKQRDYYDNQKTNNRESTYESGSYNSQSTDQSGCTTAIVWLVGIGIALFAAVWLAVNIVLPVALLNSAVTLTVLALTLKQRKTLFAALALVGGSYMLLDVINGWFSLIFVEKVVKSSDWISAFVYLNATAIGMSTWILIQPMWLKANQMELTDKNKVFYKIGIIILIVLATSLVPIIYHSVPNPFVRNPISFNMFAKNKDVNLQNENTSEFVAVINADALRGRNEPNKNNDNVIFRLEKGIVLSILDETTSPDGESWYKVKYGTKNGWISSSYAIKNKISDQFKSTDNDIQFKKMQFIGYGCGDSCYLTLLDLQTNKEESFMFWSKFGILSELGWDEEGKTQNKYKGAVFEVTLNRKFKEWSSLYGNDMVTNKEWVWCVVEMLPAAAN